MTCQQPHVTRLECGAPAELVKQHLCHLKAGINAELLLLCAVTCIVFKWPLASSQVLPLYLECGGPAGLGQTAPLLVGSPPLSL